jgi:hypothetical protein
MNHPVPDRAAPRCGRSTVVNEGAHPAEKP